MKPVILATTDMTLATIVQDLATLAERDLRVLPTDGPTWLETDSGRVQLYTPAQARHEPVNGLVLPTDNDAVLQLFTAGTATHPVWLGLGWASAPPRLLPRLAAALGTVIVDARAYGFVPGGPLAWADIASGTRAIQGRTLRAALAGAALSGDARGGAPGGDTVRGVVQALAREGPVWLLADDAALATICTGVLGWEPGGKGAVARARALAAVNLPLVLAVGSRDVRWRRALAGVLTTDRAGTGGAAGAAPLQVVAAKWRAIARSAARQTRAVPLRNQGRQQHTGQVKSGQRKGDSQ